MSNRRLRKNCEISTRLAGCRGVAASIALASVLLCLGETAAAEPVRVILDTDISGDVDDVLALAMLHALADRGECVIEAVTISKIHPLTAPFVDAVNTFYGRPDIPIGVTRNAQRRTSKYLRLVDSRDGDRFRYPHDLLSSDDAPDALSVRPRSRSTNLGFD